MISPSLTISGIQVVSIENKLCLECTISAYSGDFSASTQYFHKSSVQFFLTFNSLNSIVDYSLARHLLLRARCL